MRRPNRTRHHRLNGVFAALTTLGAALIVLVAIVLLPTVERVAANPAEISPSNSPASTTPPESLSRTVSLVIDYADGVEKHFPALPCPPGMTVMDALLAADTHPRGIDLDFTGSGETAFIRRIDDLTNQGSGKSSKNWQFSVDATLAKRGAGVYLLSPGQHVRWMFRTGTGEEATDAQTAPVK